MLRKNSILVRFLSIVFLVCTWPAIAQVSVVDDLGNTITFTQPPQRIVSLAPHITEALFAAGAGDRVVGVVEYSDYPEAAKQIASVGSYTRLDFERLLSLKPDLVVAWHSGNPVAMRAKVASLGLPIYLSEPRNLDDVVSNVERLAILIGTEAQAAAVVKEYREGLSILRANNRNKTPVRVFYQIWNRPLMTVNGQHLISKVIELCGGVNLFAELDTLAPQVSLEAVLLADPQIIVASGMAHERPEWLSDWLKWQRLSAVKGEHLVVIHPDIIQRHTLRILQGAEQMCQHLDKVRAGFKTE